MTAKKIFKKSIIGFIAIVSMILLTLCVSADPIDDNIHYWKSDTNGSYPDSAGDNNGSITGATFVDSGKINGSYSYDGNDGINVGNISLNGIDFSIGMWAKKDINGNSYRLMGQGTALAGQGLEVAVISNGAVRMAFYGGANTDTGTNLWTDTSNYHHIVVTWDHSTKRRVIYFDNSVELNATDSQTYSGTGELYIGRRYDATTQFEGDIDEVSIWNRTLTPAEVETMWNSGNGLQYPYTVTVDYNTSALGEEIEIENFTVSGDTYQLIDSIEINTTKDLVLAFPSTLNAQKTISAGSNNLYIRYDLDGYTIYDDIVRSMDSDNTGSTGLFPSNTTLSGSHTLDVYAREEGIGNVDVFNYNLFIGTPETNNGGVFTYDSTGDEKVNVTIPAGEYRSVSNLSFTVNDTAKVLYISDIKASDNSTDELRFYLNNSNTNAQSIPILRSLSGGSTGALSVNGILPECVAGQNNYTLWVYSENDTDLELSVSQFLYPTVDNDSYHFASGNNSYNSDPDSPVNVSTGSTLLHTTEFEMFEGNSLLFHYTMSGRSNGGLTGSTIRINVSNSSHTLESDIIQRDFDGNYGNVYIIGHASGLISGEKYNVSVVHIGTTNSLEISTDSLMLLELSDLDLFQELDTTVPNLTLTIPDNTSQYFNTAIEGLCEDKFAVVDVDINDSRFVYNTSRSASNWSFWFNESAGVYDLAVSINCTDINGNTNTSVFNLLIDTTDPSIVINNPIQDSRINSSSVLLNVSIDDDRLYNSTIILTMPNGSIAYRDDVTDHNSTNYNISYSYVFNVSDGFGIWNLSARACDSHTKQAIDFSQWDI